MQVITICSLKHRSVWVRTSRLLPQLLNADSFVVYVPNEEVTEFANVTGPAVTVLSQGSLTRPYLSHLTAAVAAGGNLPRLGWYLQQFLKIEALLQAPGDMLTIWDADCVPVRPIPLLDSLGRPLYMTASEYHEEYFRMIHRLLGLQRIQEDSFVIPGFPLRKEWLTSLIATIEARHPGSTWFEAIIANIDFTQPSGFSETETLGTWIANTYPGLWSTTDLHWERLGRSRFGDVSNFTEQELVALGDRHDLDIISFENWDKRNLKWAARRVRSMMGK